MKNLLLLIVIAAIISSCKKDDVISSISLNKSEITLQHADSIQLVVTPNIECTWNSGDANVATVSKTGLVKGVRIGNTKIFANYNSLTVECNVTCTPKSFFYKEPFYYYGQSKSYVKGKETRTLYAENPNSLVYRGENSNITGVLYSFSNDKLESALVGFKDNAGMIKAAEFIQERYIYVGLSGTIIIFKDGKGTCLGLSVLPDYDFGYYVLYYPETGKKSTKFDIDQYSKIKESFKIMNHND